MLQIRTSLQASAGQSPSPGSTEINFMDSFEAAEAKRWAKMRSLLPARGEIKSQMKSQYDCSTEVDDNTEMDDYLQDDLLDLSRDIPDHPKWPVRGYSSRHKKSNAEKK